MCDRLTPNLTADESSDRLLNARDSTLPAWWLCSHMSSRNSMSHIMTLPVLVPEAIIYVWDEG